MSPLQTDALNTGSVLLCDPKRGWLLFERPLRILKASETAEVLPLLKEVEQAVAEGRHAAGFVSYEAAPAFDPAFRVRPNSDFPLAWFGLYETPTVVELPANDDDPLPPEWTPSWDEGTFTAKVASIREAIAHGETYQINCTFPLRTDFSDDVFSFFIRFVRHQGASCAAYIDTGRFVVASASPELFFELEGGRLACRPMKGTIPRAPSWKEDAARRETLRTSQKDRAENVMILDMVRNDLGRLGGPVEVADLFVMEKYPTVWQMTSTAITRTDAPLSAIFEALFPCASITGAPKVRTMEIIADIESTPRGIYTGAIGYAAPGGRARFGVAIRTALLDHEKKTGEYGVGAGITWESGPSLEYRECLAKGRILQRPLPDFEIIETLLWTPADGYSLIDEHLARMARSADYFDVPFDGDEARRVLETFAKSLSPVPHKVRLLLALDGTLRREGAPLPEAASQSILKVVFAKSPVDATDPFLYHKTTRRTLYEEARIEAPEADETILWNDRQEVTEACNANLVVELGGKRITPPVECGLLAGTLRERLLREGDVVEGVVRLDDLRKAQKIWLINSVRGWREAVLAP